MGGLSKTQEAYAGTVAQSINQQEFRALESDLDFLSSTSGFWEKFLLKRKWSSVFYMMLSVLGIPGLNPDAARRIKFKIKKTLIDLQKEREMSLEIRQIPEKMWLAKIENGHSYAPVRIFFGYTSGAVKELSNITNHSTLAAIPVRGIFRGARQGVEFEGKNLKYNYQDGKKDILTRLYTGNSEQSATMGQLASMYNSYFEEYCNPDKIKELKVKFGLKKPNEANEKDYEFFGLMQEFSAKVNMESSEFNSQELHHIYWWMTQCDWGKEKTSGRALIAADMKTQIAALAKSGKKEEAAEMQGKFNKMFTYEYVGKNLKTGEKEIQRMELPTARQLLDKWIDTTGWTEELMHTSARDHQQKIMMFMLKGGSKIVNYHTKESTALEAEYFKNPFDYLNRAFGKAASGYVARYGRQVETRQKNNELDEQIKQIDELLKMEETRKEQGGDLDENQEKRYEQLINHLEEFMEGYLEDLAKQTLSPEDRQLVGGIVKKYVEGLKQDGKLGADVDTRETEISLAKMLVGIVKVARQGKSLDELTDREIKMLNGLLNKDNDRGSKDGNKGDKDDKDDYLDFYDET